MKRAVSVLLSVLILFTSMGFTFSSHICGGKRVKTALGIGKSEMFCEGMAETKKCDASEQLQSNCCQNEYKKIQVADDYTPQLPEAKLFVDFILVAGYCLLPENATTEQDFFRDHSPPPLTRDIPVLVQSFLI